MAVIIITEQSNKIEELKWKKRKDFNWSYDKHNKLQEEKKCSEREIEYFQATINNHKLSQNAIAEILWISRWMLSYIMNEKRVLTSSEYKIFMEKIINITK